MLLQLNVFLPFSYSLKLKSQENTYEQISVMDEIASQLLDAKKHTNLNNEHSVTVDNQAKSSNKTSKPSKTLVSFAVENNKCDQY